MCIKTIQDKTKEHIYKYYGIDPDYVKHLSEKDQEIANLNNKYAGLNTLYNTSNIKLAQCTDALTLCRNKYVELEEWAKASNTKIPSADITYQRPVLVGDKIFEKANIDIRKFIQPDFLMEHDIEKAGLEYTPEKDFDTLVPQIYKLAKKNYSYGSDKTFGFSELWLFPFELRYLRTKKLTGDCEDWSNWIGSYFAAANIPRKRWWNSCGTTRSGEGHCTIYLQDNNGVWKHTNSTAPYYFHKDLKDYPSKDDPEDTIGIEEGGWWFSYHDKASVHKFETEFAEAGFLKELGNKIDITPKEMM